MFMTEKQALNHVIEGWSLKELPKRFRRDIDFILNAYKYDHTILHDVLPIVFENEFFLRDLKLIDQKGYDHYVTPIMKRLLEFNDDPLKEALSQTVKDLFKEQREFNNII